MPRPTAALRRLRQQRGQEPFGGERAKLLDFGIAKLVAEGVSRTSTGAVFGTPLCMSPEQCQGAKLVDARSDLYSLGCMLFEMISGRPPFVSDGVGELIGMHQFVAPPALSTVAPDVPPEVGALGGGSEARGRVVVRWLKRWNM